ncbi:SUMO-conjugating enzyme UBC9-A isoform X3 [Hydra vulgaris]|uniref:SUMO-conjugating enzyme UBC9-A isoform X3 n=1 Tax=Hydra vulgaris TaxID=6087 RepID=A0ABM4BCS1_HYDVU
MKSVINSIADERLKEEYNAWKVNHPRDFKAEPLKDSDIENWKIWNCSVPGVEKTSWEGGHYKLRLEFTDQYPHEPPKCIFDPPIFHPNVFPSGKVSLSLLEKDWIPQITIKQVLLGIQLLLNDPNFNDPAQVEAFVVHSNGKHLYEQRVKEQAKLMKI